MTVQIVEILGPSDQGKSRPYKCRGEDDAIYYVKGRQTNRASLWHEWICGHLALWFGLHIPPFEIVEVGEHLLRETTAEWQDLGLGGTAPCLPSCSARVALDQRRDGCTGPY